MSNLFVQRFDALWVEEPLTHGALAIFPLSGVRHGDVRYALLPDALAAKTLAIAECDEPDVNALRVVNTGELPVLILDGTELVGGKQNRIAAASLLVPPGATTIPVSCVEQGRWGVPLPAFAAPDVGYLSLRAEQARSIHAALHSTGVHDADQGGVWEAVGAAQSAAGIASPTGAMRDLYRHRAPDLATFTRAIPCPESAVGMVVAIGGRIRALECFDNAQTLRVVWESLIRAAALDAMGVAPGAPVAITRAVRMIHRIRDAKSTAFRSPGLGHDVRFSGGGIAGAALLYHGVPLHTTLFRQHET